MKPDITDLRARVGEMVRGAGIDNFHIENNILTMCGTRYVVEYCGCSDPDCNGLRLRKVRHLGKGGGGAVDAVH